MEKFGSAFSLSLEQDGLVVERREKVDKTPPDAPLLVFWGHKKSRLIDHQRSQQRHYLVLERGYFGDRFKMTSVGWDGLNGRANFCNQQADGKRWERYGWGLPEWKGSGDYALICGQVAGDAAVTGVNLAQWYQDVVELIKRSEPRLPIRFRPHPLEKKHNLAPKNATITQDTLENDLKRALFTVAYNSNTGVDSLLGSVPHYCGDHGSMALPVAVLIENPAQLHKLPVSCRHQDRQSWANRLAYCQWTVDELQDGTTWRHLRSFLETNPVP